jgi:hypothetical protein
LGGAFPPMKTLLLSHSDVIRDKKQRCALFNRLVSITLGREKPLANRAANDNLLIYLAIISHPNFSPSRAKIRNQHFPLQALMLLGYKIIDMQLFEFTVDPDWSVNPRSIESAFSEFQLSELA